MVKDHYLETCGGYGEQLTEVDPNPHRHQFVEIPPKKLFRLWHRVRDGTFSHRVHATGCLTPSECLQK